MHDNMTTVATLRSLSAAFVKERDWRQFHGAKNLSMAIVSEAVELMEIFMWAGNAQEAADILKNKRSDVQDEVADIINAVLIFCDEFDIDLSSALKDKIAKNALKYPIEKAKGVNKKYNEL